MSPTNKSQSALEYMMTYGWAILVIVIVAAVLYSLGIFSPSSSLSTTITGFANLGTVNAVCLGGTSFTISMGDSTGYPINVTEINLASSSGKTTYSPNILIQPNSIQTVTVPSSSLCTSGARYSVSAVISYLEPGQIFPGPYTSTGTVAGTANSLPSSATLYEPLNITNTQNQGTPSPFQQMINVTSTSPGWGDISSSPFGQNVEFFSSTGQILDSWLENYTSTHAIWWVKLTSSIPAGSKQTIYMGFAPTSTNLFNTNNIGAAPQLSSTYAEYDDGANVFTNYWNFAGTTLPSGWSTEIPSGATITQNNGITFTTSSSAGYVGIIYTTGIPSPVVLEGDVTSWSGVAGGLAEQASSACNTEMYIFNGWNGGYEGYSPSTSQGMCAGFSSLSTSFAFSTGIEGLVWYSNSGQTWYNNYNSYTTSSTSAGNLPADIYPSIGIYSSSPSTSITYQWLRTRAYPPNGVMPSVSFGSIS